MRPILIALTIASALAVTGGLFIMLNPKTENSSRFLKSLLIEDAWTAWTAWKMQNGRSYGTNSEETYRFAIFTQNYQLVQNFDGKSHTFTIGLNQFADLTFAEFEKIYLGSRMPIAQNHVKHSSLSITPDSVDWRGIAVTDVKNQGHCGSCWAFSATGGSEGAYAIKNKQIKSFSEQQLVDCAIGDYNNAGCNGGHMDEAFKYIRDHGIAEESDYGYTGKAYEMCRAPTLKMAFKISGYYDVPKADNSELMKAIAVQPISVGLHVDYNFQLYKGGIYDNWDCLQFQNHGVLAVGYGTDEDNGDFYLLKNSWGATWGEDGYIRLARKDSGVGMCGVTEYASYPVA